MRKQYLFLHLSILLFSFTGVFSKVIALSISSDGILTLKVFVLLSVILLNCLIYAVMWQQNLKKLNISTAYSHRSIYNIWSLIWAVLFFSEQITIGNIAGTALMIGGVLLIQNE